MKVVALVQARTGSVRLPQKVLKPILNKPMIELLLARLSRSTELDEIVVATSKEKSDDKLESTVESLGFKCTRGSEKDVLDRNIVYKKVVKQIGLIQFMIGNILEPRLTGSSLNISPLVVILSLALWGSIWGIVGMFLCVPLTVIAVIVLSYFEPTRPIAILLSGNGKIEPRLSR